MSKLKKPPNFSGGFKIFLIYISSIASPHVIITFTIIIEGIIAKFFKTFFFIWCNITIKKLIYNILFEKSYKSILRLENYRF